MSVWYAGLTMATRKTFKSVLDLHFTLKKKRKENVRRNVIHLDLR